MLVNITNTEYRNSQFLKNIFLNPKDLYFLQSLPHTRKIEFFLEAIETVDTTLTLKSWYPVIPIVAARISACKLQRVRPFEEEFLKRVNPASHT